MSLIPNFYSHESPSPRALRSRLPKHALSRLGGLVGHCVGDVRCRVSQVHGPNEERKLPDMCRKSSRLASKLMPGRSTQLGTRELTVNQQKCQNASIPSSGCGSIANRSCVCKQPSAINSDLDSCETATCSASDLQSMMSSFSFLLSLCWLGPGTISNMSEY